MDRRGVAKIGHRGPGANSVVCGYWKSTVTASTFDVLRLLLRPVQFLNERRPVTARYATLKQAPRCRRSLKMPLGPLCRRGFLNRGL